MDTKKSFMVLQLFDGPHNAFNSAHQEPITEKQVVQHWFWCLQNLQNFTKSQIRTKIATDLLKYYKKKHGYIDCDLKSAKTATDKVKSAISRAEKLTNFVQKMDDDEWIKRKRKPFETVLDVLKVKFQPKAKTDDESLSDCGAIDNDPKDPDFQLTNDEEDDVEEIVNINTPKYNTQKYPGMIGAIIRYGISDEAIVDVLNNYLVDRKVEDESEYFSTQKINRMRTEHYEVLKNNHRNSMKNVKSIGFDGKKSDVKTKGGKWIKKVDKVAVICQSTRQFIHCFTPENGTGLECSVWLLRILKMYQSDESLQGCAADGTGANTGKFNGAIRLLEVALRRPLQWQICVMHFIELIFRHLFIAIGKHISQFTCQCDLSWKIKLEILYLKEKN